MKFISIIFIIALLSLSLHAQKGSISGTILEAESGYTVIGASVMLQGTSLGTATDLDGLYAFSDVDPGTYSVEITYIGYESKIIEDIEVKANEVTTLDVTLGNAPVEIEVVTVSAEVTTNTETSILTMQRKSSSVLDGISSAQIGKTGDNDAASAIKRITGVTVEGGKYVYVRGLGDRYSKTTLNGSDIPGLDPNRNTVQMDLFPTNLLDNILVYKSFTPDLPGDFTGGYVDIKTKDFPEAFTFNASASIGYNTIATFNSNLLAAPSGRMDWLGFDDGNRQLPTTVDGVAIPNYNPSQFNQADAQTLIGQTTSFPSTWDVNRQAQPFNHNLSISIGDQIKFNKSALGIVGALTYQRNYSGYNDGDYGLYTLTDFYDNARALTPQLTLKDSKGQQEVLWGALFNLSYKAGPSNKISFTFMHNQSGTSTMRTLYGKKQQDDPDEDFYTQTTRFLQRGLTTYQLGGKHVAKKANDLKVEWRLSYANSTQDDPDLRFFTYRYRPTSDTYIVKLASDRPPSRFYRNMTQGNLSGRVDFTMPFKQWNDQKSLVKFGGAYTYKDRVFREDRYIFNNNLPSFDGTTNDYFTPLAISAEGNAFANNGYGAFVTNGLDTANNYDANQGVGAAYAMIELPLTKKLKFIGGVRMETTQVRLRSLSWTLQQTKYPELDGKTNILDNIDFLPSATFNYEFTDQMKLRLAYSRTLARPTFRELAPFASFDVEGGYLFIGNPDLERTVVDNADVRWEFYPTFAEIISVGAFFKNFTNPIERTYNPEAPNGEFTFRNVPNAILAGAEVEIRKNFGFISEKLTDLSAAVNFSYVYSRMTIDATELANIQATNPNVSPYRAMFGQSPYSINALISYKNEGLGLITNLVFNVSGARIAYVTAGGTPNIYSMPVPSLNFNVSKKFGDFTLRFAASNLLNSKYREVIPFKGSNYPVQVYDLGMNISVGVRYALTKS
ncbi:MAG: TonB-dependent receptor [Saprospiraceae bacterium]|nr:TonB-dependent receptor [Saprospiraceae bacterium]